VLCSVDVAVIIFGHNKKLYEFSSGDINDTIGRYQYVCLPPTTPDCELR
jgi:MADS-box transcription factor